MKSTNFDRIARSYRWLEYLTLGSALQRCRVHFLKELAKSRRALVLGDGDGRFLYELLAGNSRICVDAVDRSAVMLELLRGRSEAFAERLKTYQVDAVNFIPVITYDLVVTHFFLDCLSQVEVEKLVRNVEQNVVIGGIWVVSEFRVPDGILRWPGWLFLRGLYLAFRLITGLKVTSLPNYAGPLGRAGFVCEARRLSLFGLLTSELWRRRDGQFTVGDPVGSGN